MRIKKSASLVALLLGVTTAFTACGGGDSSTASGSTATTTTAADAGSSSAVSSGESSSAGSAIDKLSVCIASDPNTIDPALFTTLDGASMISHMFEGIYRINPENQPELAQASDVTISEDGKTYTITLRDDITWHDGTPITSADYLYSWQRVVDPKTAADYSYLFDLIAGFEEAQSSGDMSKLQVTAPDEKTLVVTLNAPCPYFTEMLANPSYSPVKKDVVESNGEQWSLSADTYISNGAYKLKEWVQGSHIEMVKNDAYWDKEDVVGPGSLRFVLMDDDNAMLSGYQSDELQMIDYLPVDEVDAWNTKSEYKVADQYGVYYVSYNVQREPMNNPLVRKALTLAVDRDFVTKNIGKAGQIPASAFVPKVVPDADPTKSFRDIGKSYFDPTAEANAANLEEAKNALAEAGYPEGKGLPTLTYIYNNSTQHQQIAEALQSMWKDIGVNVELKSQEWGVFVETRKNGDYDIARNGWVGDYNDPITFLDLMTSTSANNDGQWRNPDFDAVIKEIKSEGDQAKRFELMHKAEDLMFDDWMLCPIWFNTDDYLIKDNLQGYWCGPGGIKYFKYTTQK